MATPKVTYRKHGGDDLYSWAVFIGDRMVLNGLSRREARYEASELRLDAAAKRQGVTRPR